MLESCILQASDSNVSLSLSDGARLGETPTRHHHQRGNVETRLPLHTGKNLVQKGRAETDMGHMRSVARWTVADGLQAVG
jgi:hypothetical protein